MTDRFRRAGSRWRLLVHRMRPGGVKGAAFNVQSHRDRSEFPLTAAEQKSRQDSAAIYSVDQIIPGCDFDELVVGSWLHVEQMDTDLWWLNIGGMFVHVRADRDGKPVEVNVTTDPEHPVDGCTYIFDGMEYGDPRPAGQ